MCNSLMYNKNPWSDPGGPVNDLQQAILAADPTKLGIQLYDAAFIPRRQVLCVARYLGRPVARLFFPFEIILLWRLDYPVAQPLRIVIMPPDLWAMIWPV